jgi:hypothetical protein
MGSNLDKDDISRHFPQSIIDWELKHGIVGYEKNGMISVRGQYPEDVIFESIRREREQIKEREYRQKRGEAV